MCYILLLTCCFSRGILLKLTTDISSETFLQALRRFTFKHGCPKIIASDNFKSFKSSEVKSFVANKEISWNFILEHSAWWGALCEKSVAIVKNSLKKVLGIRKKKVQLHQTYDDITRS